MSPDFYKLLDATDRAILDYLYLHPQSRIRAIASAIHLSRNPLSRRLKQLEEAEIVCHESIAIPGLKNPAYLWSLVRGCEPGSISWSGGDNTKH